MEDSDTYSELVKVDRNTRALAVDEPTYKLEIFEKNAMIIFNHYYFTECHVPRIGTVEDGIRIKETLAKFGFEGKTHFDLTKEEVFQELRKCKSVFLFLLVI